MAGDMDGFFFVMMVVSYGFPIGALLAITTVLLVLSRSHRPFWLVAVLSCLANGCLVALFGCGGIGRGIPWFLNVPIVSLVVTLMAMGRSVYFAVLLQARPSRTDNHPSTPE